MTAAVVAEGLAIVVLAALVFNLLRTQARVLDLLRVRDAGGGAPPGAPVGPGVGPVRPRRGSRVGRDAAAVEGTDPAGAGARVDPGGDPAVLAVFLTTSCSTCQGIWSALADGGARQVPGSPRLVVVVPGPGLESRRRVAELAPPGIDVVMSADAWAAYEVTGSPFAVLVRHGRVAAEGPLGGWDALLDLAATTT